MLSAVFALFFVAPALADVKAGVDAWTQGDFARAVREWEGPAARGDTDAQFNLAQAYKLGHGVKQDLTKAEELYARAAAKGHLHAADNLGLLMYQRGERTAAMPYLRNAADRGDPRAQYLVGLAHFNGDLAPKDWVRAYALVTLAQQQGLEQARVALVQMDQYIPLDQRKLAVSLAADMGRQADATRARQLAAADLRGDEAETGAIPSPGKAVAAAARVAGKDSPATAGAEYARPRTATASARLTGASKPAAKPATLPAAALERSSAIAPGPARPAIPAEGPWRVQLGAFSVAGNADALWNRVKVRPELTGHARINARSGAITRLMAGGFASQGAAQAACNRLSAAGFSCLPVRN